jgi:acetyltransferase-like isoleucine patch superfamily enzyme
VYIGQGTVISAREEITVGSDTLIAEHVTIRDQDHQFGIGKITSEAGFSTSPVFIEDNVWIGAKATIMKGVRIGKNSVVGANSVVTRNVPCDVVVAGVPAKIIQ